MLFLKILSKIGKTKLIAIFKVTICWIMFLDRIICQMDPIIGKGGRISCILTGARTNVTLFKKVAVKALRYEYPYSYIKFSSFYKQRIFNILLYYKLRAFY